ncbi:MAG: KamA family radical SAM protein, partial [Acidobacteriota bacterium]|nr:KamA family radical SAM protein [Acidobacteriota bacterium]
MKTTPFTPVVTHKKTKGPFATRREILERLALEPALYDALRRRFPISWPSDYLNLVGADPADDPIARLGRPEPDELSADPGDIADPISDQVLRPVPFLVRKHRDRVIILAAKRCHFYCRFCFRREEPVSAESEPGPADWNRITDYLAAHPEIQEPILSGGDPLTLSDAALFEICDRLAAVPSVKRLRIHTRAPVHYPRRITTNLIKGLARHLPLSIITHFNHPREITEQSARIAELILEHGIGFKNQAVLLRGVNDDPKVQAELWRDLSQLGIGAHYLHHPDRVSGNARFRLTVARGLQIYAAMKQQIPENLPAYVLDLPDGRGKVPVTALQRLA